MNGLPERYADLVAYVGADNTPPGAEETVAFWIATAEISCQSRILDLACSTAYSGRSVVRRLGCQAVGVDISPFVIEKARRIAAREGLDLDLVEANAEGLPIPSSSVSHVLAGSVFGFFANPRSALAECARVLIPGGYLCTATFYYTCPPPQEVIEAVADAADFWPRVDWTRAYWDGFFGERFHLVSSKDGGLPVAPEKDVVENCLAMVETSAELAALSAKDKAAVLRRLVYCRLIFNEHRRYQRYVAQVWCSISK